MKRLIIALRDIFFNRRASWMSANPVLMESEVKWVMKKTDLRMLTYLVVVILLVASFGIFAIQTEKEIEALNKTNASLQIEKDDMRGQIKELKQLNDAADKLIKTQAELIDELLSPFEPEAEKVDRGGERLISLGTYTITAYCSCKKCCGKYANNRPGGKVYGASGEELQDGVSVAAWLPFGTQIIIGDKVYTVQDRTAQWIREKYDSRIIDLYYSNHAEALAWGKREIEVFAEG